MDKSNKIYMVIILICTLVVVGICAFAIATHQEENKTDAIKFKREYEKYNDALIEGTKNRLVKVSISENNPIVYKTPKEIVDVLNNETAVIFLGNPICSLTRCAIEAMLKSASHNNIDKIYYVNIDGIRDEYKLVGFLKFKTLKEGSQAYKEILKIFGDKLNEYYLPDKNGNLFATGVRRLYSPTLALVKNKEIIAMHEKTIATHDDEFRKLNTLEEKELIEIYNNIFAKLKEYN